MDKINIFVIGLSIGLLILACCLSIPVIIDNIQEIKQLETIELRIEHLWEENGKYYFADTNGHIYKLGNYININEKILYNDIPKQRFEMLNKGCVYNCTYISGTNNWISISETVMER